MRQRVLVLGANGFIGRRLVAELRVTGWAEPIAGVRRRAPAPHTDVEFRIVDATSGPAVAKALVGVDAVVNCVAGDEISISEGARALFAAAARAASTPRVVHLSSMSVYGDATGLIDEAAPLRGNLGWYSAAKVAAEKAATAYSRTVILRPGCVYGPASPEWSARIGRLLTAGRLGDLGAAGNGHCNLVYIDDVVTAIIRCLSLVETAARTFNIFNLCGPDPPTWNEFLIRYGRALGAAPLRRISARSLQIETALLGPALKLLELACAAATLGHAKLPPRLPRSVLRLMRQEIRLDVRRATDTLGLAWKNLDAGLEETARWYHHEGLSA
jgi:2-alkyl-3-oxoalkanoate reductase